MWIGDVRMSFQRFYTYPPYKYPYVLRKIYQEPLECEHEIVDIGVFDLLKYGYYEDSRIEKFKYLEPNGWKVVPDYPHGLNCSVDNVKLSWKLLEDLYNPDDPTHMPVIQGYGDCDSSFEYCARLITEFGVPKQVGVGISFEYERFKEYVVPLIGGLRRMLPDTWIHVFGLHFKHLPHVYKELDSYDTMAWTMHTPTRKSSMNIVERMDALDCYLIKLWKVVNDGVRPY